MLENCASATKGPIKLAVSFSDIQLKYELDKDLECSYSLSNYTPQQGDRIAIFKLGWTSIKDFIAYAWASESSTSDTQTVVLKKEYLPQNTSELYHFCYISSENILHGASTPFQFTKEPNFNFEALPHFNLNESIMATAFSENGKITELKQHINNLSDKEKQYVQNLQEMYSLTNSLNGELARKEHENNVLKKKIEQMWEMYRALYMEKSNIEKRYNDVMAKINLKVCENNDYELGELDAIPPFPFTSNMQY